MKIGNQVSQSTFGSLKFIPTGVPMLLKASKTTLILLICLGLAISLGCKSVDFGKPKLPTLPSLAFWKKDSGDELPPPPARHFDPARFGGDAETQVAHDGSSTREEVPSDGSSTREPASNDGSSTRDQVASQGSSTRPSFDQYGRRVKDSASEGSDLASKGLNLPKDSLKKLADQPIRKPYKLDDIAGDDTLAKPENSFNLDASNLKNRFDDVKTSASNQLTGAQQDFQSALNSAKQLKSSGDNAIKSGGAFAGGDNSFAADPVAKAVDTAKGFGGGSFLPKSDAFANVKQKGVNAAVAAKNSLYDAQGRLRSAASGLANKTQDLVQGNDNNQLKTMFEQKLLAAQKQAKTSSEAFKSGTLKAKDQLSALADVSDRTKELVTQPFPKNLGGGNFVPNNSGQLTNQSVSQANPSLVQINKPNSLDALSLGSANKDSVAQMRSEVEEAKRQIASLKAQVAAAKQAAATQQGHRVSQNTIEGVVVPATPQPRAPNSLQYDTNSGSNSNSFYPSTPYGGFGSAKQPQATIGRVGFDSANEFQNQVSRANAEITPSTQGSDIPRASRIGDTVTEVLIPSSILSGSSSFTPGSTTPLR